MDLRTRRVEITSQNHNFAVAMAHPISEMPEQLPVIETSFGQVLVTHLSLNDRSIEGLASVDHPVFSVQYHPEASPGPHDSAYLFTRIHSVNGETACLALSAICLFEICLLASHRVCKPVCVTVNLIEPSGPVKETQLSGTGDGKVLLLDLSGVISSQDKEGLVPHPNMLATFKEELTKAAKDEKIKAVVVRINSPGGTVTASDILYHELREFKIKKKDPRDRLDDGCGGVRGLLSGHGSGQYLGPSLDGHGQYRRHYVDRQCEGIA